jgi:hypothetical protein
MVLEDWFFIKTDKGYIMPLAFIICGRMKYWLHRLRSESLVKREQRGGGYLVRSVYTLSTGYTWRSTNEASMKSELGAGTATRVYSTKYLPSK